MDSFDAVMVTITAVVFLTLALVCGFTIARDAIVEDCENFEQFSVDGEVYDCALQQRSEDGN